MQLIAAQHLDVVDTLGVHGRSGKAADLANAVTARRSTQR